MSCVVQSRVNCRGFWFNPFYEIHLDKYRYIKRISEGIVVLQFALEGLNMRECKVCTE